MTSTLNNLEKVAITRYEIANSLQNIAESIEQAELAEESRYRNLAFPEVDFE